MSAWIKINPGFIHYPLVSLISENINETIALWFRSRKKTVEKISEAVLVDDDDTEDDSREVDDDISDDDANKESTRVQPNSQNIIGGNFSAILFGYHVE